MLGISTNKYVILFLINVFLLILGCLLEPIPALIITTPIFMPIVKQHGIDPRAPSKSSRAVIRAASPDGRTPPARPPLGPAPRPW
jgi:TRAP-type C4-dicarboxylate transport system permease large subunit